MTPKNKAKVPLNKYIDIMPCLANQTGEKIMNHAKKCALICVNESIEHCSQVEPFLGVDYWYEIKSEIEKL